MSNEVRKPPRASCEFLKIEWDPVVETFSLDWFFEIAPEANQHVSMGLGMAEVKELIKVLSDVLPGDDSIRVSRLDWDEIKARMEYTNSYPRKSCAEFLERIERESKGE